jgi:glycosyltransferase involved in cell wall biosynthesis
LGAAARGARWQLRGVHPANEAERLDEVIAMKYYFFTLRDFKKEVGENVRMYGMLNSLAAQGHEVVFLSNAEKYQSFHHAIQHVCIGYDFKEKRRMQGLLALLPASVVYQQFRPLFGKIEAAIERAGVGSMPVCFFDYLDNTIGYLLKATGVIQSYINDIHGISTIEQLYQQSIASNSYQRWVHRWKYFLVNSLDRKVFSGAAGLIYGSNSMKKYYEQLYRLEGKQSFVIPYLVSEDALRRQPDATLQRELKVRLGLAEQDFVVLFIGTYKQTGGMDDLIKAFDLLHRDIAASKLIMIGEGPYKDYCVKLAQQLPAANAIHFIKNISYAEMATYQSLAHVIVCPDKENPFSQHVVHVKYFDALISDRLVINGAFDSVKEINQNDELSLTFKPSDVADLYAKLVYCRGHYEELCKKYAGVKEYVAQHLTYNAYVKNLRFDYSVL